MALVLAVVVGPFVAVVLWSGGLGALAPGDWAAVRFTLLQAFASATLSVLLAIPVARAIARRNFPGRRIVITLLGAPFILPVIVAVLGILAVFGRAGLLNTGLAYVGLPTVSVYGLRGVVLAHVFFNLPLAVRIFLQGLNAIPAERFRLAAALNAPPWRLLEWPALRRAAPGAFAVIFLICLTSFAVALTLGGGPRATTVEVAIYQAIRFDFDLGKGATLALLQAALGLSAAALALLLSRENGLVGAGLDRIVMRWDRMGRMARIGDVAVIVLAVLFLLLPLVMVVLRGLPGLAAPPAGLLPAMLRSLVVAVASAGVSTLLALAIAMRGGWPSRLGAALPLAFSAIVTGTGLFLIVFRFANPVTLALPVTAVLNALTALPFALQVVGPAVSQAEEGFGRLADALGLAGWTRVRLLILPRVRQPLGFAAGLAAALSMGDLGVIVLFAADRQETLPLLMYRLMGAYRMQDAAGVALVLLAASLALFWLFDRGGRFHAAP